jgi:predicted ATPase/DNA-binding winged helix-turn-helix (wHTH) protein
VDRYSYQFGPFNFFPAQHLLEENGAQKKISGPAMDLLVALVERPGEIISNDELRLIVWPDTKVDEGSLRVHMSGLRKALGENGAEGKFIINLSGKGYSFVASLTRQQVSQAKQVRAAPRIMPNLTTPVIGRSEFNQAVMDALPSNRLVTITGPGGVGKTTAALAISDAIFDRYKDGAYFIDLAPLQKPEHVAIAIASAFGEGKLQGDPFSALLPRLASQNVLIVLDNCEHLVEAVAEISEQILQAAPDVHILATSREPLEAAGESVRRLSPLKIPTADQAIDVPEALTYPAVEMFVARASAKSIDFKLTADNVQTVIMLCHHLDGIPLAIEFAAARVDEFGLDGLAERISDRFSLLNRGRRTALPRHKTLRGTMDWSYDLLSAAEALALRRLSLFVGSFTLVCGKAVAQPDVTQGDSIETIVTSLVAKSLLSPAREQTGIHYHMLEMTREYAFEKLNESGELPSVSFRHAEHCLDVLKYAESEWEDGLSPRWVATYGPRIAEVRQAIEWCLGIGNRQELGLQITAHSSVLLLPLGLIDEHRLDLERAIKIIESGPSSDPLRDAKIYIAMANVHYQTRGHLKEDNTKNAFRSAIAAARKAGDRELELKATSGLSATHITRGEYSDAVALSRDLVRAGSERDLMVHRTLAHSKFYSGELAEAKTHLEAALARSEGGREIRAIGAQFDHKLVTLRSTFAQYLWLVGRTDSAMSIIDECVEDSVNYKHPISLCHLLASAACPIAFSIGRITSARPYLDLLERTAADHSMTMWQHWCEGYKATMVSRTNGGESDRLLRRLSMQQVEGPRLEFLSVLGDDFSEPWMVEGALRANAGWCRPELIRSSAVSGFLRNRDSRQAMEKLELACRFSSDAGMLAWELRAATSMARILFGSGDDNRASSLLTDVLAKFTESFDTVDFLEASDLLSRGARKLTSA